MLDKKYKAIQLDLISDRKDNLIMKFSLSDNQTSDFYINVTRNNLKIDLSQFKTTLYIKNPKEMVLKKELTTYDKESNLYYCNLEDKYKNIEGTYSCQIIIEDESTTEKVVPLNTFKYKVFDDIMSEGVTTDIPGGKIKLEYSPDEEKITITGEISYESDSEKIKEVM